ncbi:MAG: hypothetical protein ACLR4Z_05920 [Butyricicoccaceae bacterium]
MLVVEDTPIRRLHSFEVPAPYPRTRACLTEPRMLELRESLISLLRKEVSGMKRIRMQICPSLSSCWRC